MAGVVGVVPGNSVKIKIGTSQQRAPMLIQSPILPRLHGRGGRASPRKRFIVTQPILIMYEASRLAQSRARIALRATKEPILMRDRRLVATRDMRTAFTGTFHRGLTWT